MVRCDVNAKSVIDLDREAQKSCSGGEQNKKSILLGVFACCRHGEQYKYTLCVFDVVRREHYTDFVRPFFGCASVPERSVMGKFRPSLQALQQTDLRPIKCQSLPERNAKNVAPSKYVYIFLVPPY